MIILFSFTLLISAALLFYIQPMVGKMVLPFLGGTPAVWNTCMVFFQGMLLLGYCYAHASIKLLGVKKQSILHLFIILFAALILPIGFEGETPPPTESNPAPWLLWQLFIWVGPPLFAVSASAPLLQKWFSSTAHPDANDPYFLYAASNFGSLTILLAYPLIIEPSLDLFNQSNIWMYGYFLFISLISLIVFSIKPIEQGKVQLNQSIEIKNSDRIFWIVASLVPSSLLLGVTTAITTNIAAVPLLWILPLALYLLTFIIVFLKHPTIPHSLMVRILPYAVLIIIPFVFLEFTADITKSNLLLISLHLLIFFIITMVCHGSLAKSRPKTSHLTEFYLWISVGGFLGGILNAIIAPVIFSSIYEYPIMLAIACAIQQPPGNKKLLINRKDFILPALILGLGFIINGLIIENGFSQEKIAFFVGYGIPAIICFGGKNKPARFALSVGAVMLVFFFFKNSEFKNELLINRNFFGAKRVVVSLDKKFHMLLHGGTLHGMQKAQPEYNTPALVYYHKTGPVGDIFAGNADQQTDFKAGIIGLGAGAIASYAKKDQHFIFFEIDPMMEQIAKNPEYFTYLRDCAGNCQVILGDGRLNLSKTEKGSFNLIILDAFSSDSIPAHLLTYEAIQLYSSKLKNDGLLLFHISNRYLDLGQLLSNVAAKSGLIAYERSDDNDDIEEQEIKDGKSVSHYVVMARQTEHMSNIFDNPQWTQLQEADHPKVWTDSFSNILSIIR